MDMWNYIKSEITNFYSRRNLKNDSTSILVLPEYSLGNTIRIPTRTINYQEIIEDCKDLAQNYNFNFIAGSAAINEGNSWKNRNFCIDSNGKLHFYDKQRLFNYEKKLNFIPGTQSQPVILPGNLSCQILLCSDLWFPELIRDNLPNLPDLVVVPAMSVVPNKNLVSYGKWLWHTLATTRSRENVLPVVVADWSVQPFGDSWTCGASCILNPSIKWTSESEFGEAFITTKNKRSEFIETTISMSEVYAYREYRKETGLLPE